MYIFYRIKCNQCTCNSNGAIACTKMACPPDGCNYADSFMPVGAVFMATDWCNTCTCGEGGHVSCTQKICHTPDGAVNRK